MNGKGVKERETKWGEGDGARRRVYKAYAYFIWHIHE